MKKLIIILIIIASGTLLWFKYHPVKVIPSGISMDRPRAIAVACQATGVYSLHNGEAGLILKSGEYQKVNGANRDQLRALQNPACPFTTEAME